jgi:cytidylate kinase
MYELLNPPLRIAISGKSGCGNTTVSTLLADALGVKLINYTFRQLAEETGFSLPQIIEQAKTDDSFDLRVDEQQVTLAMQGSCVLGSRLALWMLKKADCKVYLYADDEVRVRRIHEREGGDIETIRRFTATRDSEDTRRYAKLYHIDNNVYNFADTVIDTAKYNPDEIVEVILVGLRERGLVRKDD